MYSTSLLTWIMYSRAVCAIKISNAKRRAPFEFTYSWRRCFPPFITHCGTFCSSLQADSLWGKRTAEITTNQEHYFPLLSAWPCALLSPVPLHPIPASVLFSVLSLSLETSASSGCSQCFSWSEVLIVTACAPHETSLVSFPLGQQYPLKASKSQIRKRGKKGSVLCLEKLKKWSTEGIVYLV